LSRRLCRRSVSIRGCLLCQVNHLSAAAAPGQVSKNLLAFRRAQHLLDEGAEAVGVGMKIELGS